MWQPDGWARTRIGVLTPQVDLNPESEFRALAGAAVSIHAARVAQKTYDPRETTDRKIAIDRVRAFADPPQVDDAAESLATASLHDIIVKQHGGRIDVETEPGALTELIITLPGENGTAVRQKPE